MKIAVCAKNEGLESLVDERFGRCENYVIYDTETKEAITVENTAKNEGSGAGGKAVNILNQNGVEAVVVPELGPKAVKAIDAFEIKAYRINDQKTVQESIDALLEGKLRLLVTASVEEHQGLRKA